MSFGEDDAANLLTRLLTRSPLPGEARIVAEQVARAERHAISTPLAGKPGDLFAVETLTHAAMLAALAEKAAR